MSEQGEPASKCSNTAELEDDPFFDDDFQLLGTCDVWLQCLANMVESTVTALVANPPGINMVCRASKEGQAGLCCQCQEGAFYVPPTLPLHSTPVLRSVRHFFSRQPKRTRFDRGSGHSLGGATIP